MTPVDYAILALYFAAVLGLGARFFGGQKSLRDFFLAERNIPWWAAAFSGIATILSAVSFLGAPGQAFKSDLRYLQYRLGTPFALFLIGWVMIPFFYRLQVFSIYEYLERRFDVRTRLVSSVQFLVLKALFLGIAIYAPSLLFVQMTGAPLVVVVLVTGLFTTFYTTLGGVKAVIWTDTLQLFILLGGLGVAAAVIADRSGGVEAVYSAAAASGKLRFFDFSTDFSSEFTLLGGIVGGTFVLLSQYGVNQAELQKMLTTTSIPRSRMALFSSMVFASVVGLVYFLIGAGLWVFYNAHPEKGAGSIPTDRIFPKFILEELPAGIKGLLMAAVASAAMSATSSVLNSMTTVLTSDIWQRMGKRDASVSTARWITLVLGIVCTVLALYVGRLGDLLVTATKLQNFFGGSLTGVFLLGMTTRRANATGGFWGVVLGTTLVMVLSMTTRVSWMWHGVFAAAIAYGAGFLISIFGSRPPADRVADLVWSPKTASR